MDTSRNRSHWDSLGADYSENWATPSQQVLSSRETAFVIQHLPRSPGQRVLDVGIGTGRILEELVSQDQVEAVYGLDIAPQMVEICRSRFVTNPKIKALEVCDVARENLPFPTGLSFVSAIRMLKYSVTWWDIVVTRLVPHLAPGGVLVFSMPNAASVKRFSRAYAVDYYKTTQGELRHRLAAAELDVLDIDGFTKVPDLLYRKVRSPLLSRSLLAVERGLDHAMGPTRLTRELFVAARRKR